MKQYITEFIGAFFWVLVLGLSVSAEYTHLTALALGATVMAMVYMGRDISGAHYNPMITLAVWIRGGISLKEGGIYLGVHFLAALAAVALTNILVQDQSFVYILGTAGNATVIQALLVELFLSFLIALVYLNVCTGKASLGTSYYGLAVGGVLAGAVYVGHDISGGAFHPALGTMPNLLAANWEPIWVYWVGPFVGAALAGFVYRVQHAIPVVKAQVTMPEPEALPEEEEADSQEA
jgi:aquaporin Z